MRLHLQNRMESKLWQSRACAWVAVLTLGILHHTVPDILGWLYVHLVKADYHLVRANNGWLVKSVSQWGSFSLAALAALSDVFGQTEIK
jgi:hypothetical protein